jgi:hypothetical protein
MVEQPQEMKHKLQEGIEETRGNIQDTVSQLQQKVSDRFQWRKQVEDHPWQAFSVAIGAGFLLSGAGRGFMGTMMRSMGGALATASGAYVVSQVTKRFT